MKYLAFLLPLLFCSCNQKEKCTLERIPDGVFDIHDIKGNIKLTSGTEVDSLVLEDKWDDYVEESVHGYAAKHECRHTKGTDFHFRGEPIDVMLEKDEHGMHSVHLFGWFNIHKTDYVITEAEVQNGEEFTFEADTEPIHKTVVKKVVVKSCRIHTITTKDGKVWHAHWQ